MTNPVDNNTEEFSPNPYFTMLAQRDEMQRMRQDHATCQENAFLGERVIYLHATTLQMQAEFNGQIKLLQQENEQLKAENAQLRQETVDADPEPSSVLVRNDGQA